MAAAPSSGALRAETKRLASSRPLAAPSRERSERKKGLDGGGWAVLFYAPLCRSVCAMWPLADGSGERTRRNRLRIKHEQEVTAVQRESGSPFLFL